MKRGVDAGLLGLNTSGTSFRLRLDSLQANRDFFRYFHSCLGLSIFLQLCPCLFRCVQVCPDQSLISVVVLHLFSLYSGHFEVEMWSVHQFNQFRLQLCGHQALNQPAVTVRKEQANQVSDLLSATAPSHCDTFNCNPFLTHWRPVL